MYAREGGGGTSLGLVVVVINLDLRLLATSGGESLYRVEMRV